jgi:hypothetical protein
MPYELMQHAYGTRKPPVCQSKFVLLGVGNDNHVFPSPDKVRFPKQVQYKCCRDWSAHASRGRATALGVG